MTTAIRPGGREGECYQDGLDQILSNTEFETTQLEQQIQIEEDKIKALEKEIEEKEREMAEFSKVTAEMESSRERDFKQLQLNRENIDSLKHTSAVLDDHLEALDKKYQMAVLKSRDTQAQYLSTVERYQEKWENFYKTYCNMPRAKELSSMKDSLTRTSEEEAAMDAKIAHLQKVIQNKKPESWNTIIQWMVQIATVRRETEAIRGLVRSTRQATGQLEKEIELTKIAPDELGNDGEVMVQEEDNPEREKGGGGGESGTVEVSNMSMGRSDPEPMEDDCHQAIGASPPKEPITAVNSPTDLPSPDHPMMERQQTNETQWREKGVENEAIGRAQGSSIFLKPFVPPQLISSGHPNTIPPKVDKALTKEKNPSPTTILITTRPLAPSSATPRLLIRAPTPPPPSPSPSPTPSLPTRSGKSLLQLPRFSLPFQLGRATSSTSSIQPPTLPLPPTSRETTRSPLERDNTLESSKKTTTSTTSLKTPGETTGSKLLNRFQLLKPQKLTPPAEHPRPPPAKTRAPVSQSTKIPHSLPPDRHIELNPPLPLKSANPAKVPLPASVQIHSKQATTDKPSSLSPPPTCNTFNEDLSSVSAVSLPQGGHSANHQEPQNSYNIQHQTLNLIPQIPHHTPAKEHQIINHMEPMELGGADGGGGGGGGGQEAEGVGLNTSFNLTGTSLDFGNQSTEFESGHLQMFSIQPDNTFNLSQGDSFFASNPPPPPPQQAGTYGFMNEGDPSSSGGNYQDFFSQFNTTRPSESGGGFLF